MEEDDEEALLEAALKASMEDDNPTSGQFYLFI